MNIEYDQIISLFFSLPISLKSLPILIAWISSKLCYANGYLYSLTFHSCLHFHFNYLKLSVEYVNKFLFFRWEHVNKLRCISICKYTLKKKCKYNYSIKESILDYIFKVCDIRHACSDSARMQSSIFIIWNWWASNKFLSRI